METPRGELYTPITEQLKQEIKHAAQLDGGLTAAPIAWSINPRSLFRILHTNKYVSLSWMDTFCARAATEYWISDFEWYNPKQITAMGLRNIGENMVVRQQRDCRYCGKAITDARRRFFCDDRCRRASAYSRLVARRRSARLNGG
jgi:predicted nucleic acid-binding Zn ribbon protein